MERSHLKQRRCTARTRFKINKIFLKYMSKFFLYMSTYYPKNINNLDQIHDFQINENNYKYGLFTLHVLIKFLKCVLHISYKLKSAKRIITE